MESRRIVATPRSTRMFLAVLAPVLVLPLLGVGAAMAAPERIRDARQELEELNERVSVAVETTTRPASTWPTRPRTRPGAGPGRAYCREAEGRAVAAPAG